MATNARRWMAVLAATGATQVYAQGANASLEALEREFWRCDHAAAHSLLGGSTAMECSVTFEAFKSRRFGGDFAAMLAWWRANKDLAHLALSAEAKRLTGNSPP